MLDLLTGLKEGQEIINQRRAAQEAEKVGQFRGGNSGFVVNGEIRGKCPRATLLRFLGVNEQHNFSKQLMFRAGELAEQITLPMVQASWSGKILTQQEAATKWILERQGKDGIAVTGSPDIVLADETGKPEYGIECKNIMSYWTMDSVGPWGKFKQGKPEPKPDHVVQAAHYAWQLNVPYFIVYTNTVNWQVMTKGMTGLAGYDEYVTRNGSRVYRVEPFVMIFAVTINDKGQVRVTNTLTGQVMSTDITVQGIKDYYKIIIDSLDREELPPRMVNRDLSGTMLEWSMYDPKYNPLSELHDMYDAQRLSFHDFVEQARIIYSQPTSTGE